MFPRPAGSGARWRWAAVAVAAVVSCLAGQPATAQEPEITYWRIGTGAASGTYFPVGSLIANAISNPPGSRPCEKGGGCGVPGLIAVAQSTHGSVENVDSIGAGKLESGLSQADVAYWAYTGQWVYARKEPVTSLRAIANLYPESLHVVVRRDAGIKSIADLRGKRVSLGEKESGTEVGAKVILGAYGLTEADVEAYHLTPGQAADRLRDGGIEAFILVAGAPVTAIADLAVAMAAEGGPGIDLVPIAGPAANLIRENYAFFTRTRIPGGVYRGIGSTPTFSVGAQWVVSADVDEELVYGITRALWHETSRVLLDSGHPKGREIRLENALDGIAIPLHAGAQRYYREVGLID
ncbi:MAG: TAXI family TRAP transporter solute-binding subunit [Alphaproteobacteria bacterium]